MTSVGRKWKFPEASETFDLELRENVKHRMGQGVGERPRLLRTYDASPVLGVRCGSHSRGRIQLGR